LVLVSVDAEPGVTLVSRRWEHAHDSASRRVDALLPIAPDYPEGPDLVALGIRACRVCGCTDDSACEQGCGWVEDDLCSACKWGNNDV
jgi:hypothetical protein